MKNSVRKIIVLLLLAFRIVTFLAMPTYAMNIDKSISDYCSEQVIEDNIISEYYIKQSSVNAILRDDGERMIVLSYFEERNNGPDLIRLAKTEIVLIPADEDNYNEIIKSIEDIKSSTSTRGSGSYTDSGLFYGDALCITSTLYYTTLYSNNIKYGRLDSVHAKATVSNSVVIDSISLNMGEMGFLLGGGFDSYTTTIGITNDSTTYTPSSWPYVVWDASVGTAVGSIVSVTAHRGTSVSYTYDFYNYIVG